MPKIIIIHDVEKNEILEREETIQEQANREAYETEQELKKEMNVQKVAERQALLDRLGITEEEARLLLG